MWFSSQPASQPVSKDDAETEAQINAFFESSTTKSANRDDASSNATSAGQRNAKDTAIIAKAEDPCNLQYYFDEFFMCYTPKSQLRNWYRYGEQKDCGERWRDFKWCVRTRMADEETSQSMLKERQSELSARVHSGPNSEDVWAIRKEPLETPWNNTTGNDPVSIS